MKPWTPTIVKPAASYMHEQYGISEVRRIFLSNELTNMTYHTRASVTPVTNHIDQIAKMCDNANEFAFCVFIHATFLATSKTATVI